MLDIDKSLQQGEPDCRTSLAKLGFTIHRITKDDLPALVSLASNRTLIKNVASLHLPSNLERADAWLANSISQSETILMLNNTDGSNAGLATMLPVEERNSIELTIILRQSYWGHGLATAITQSLIDLAFAANTQDGPIDTIYARCRVSCPQARRLAEKCGFQYCGTGMARSALYRGMIPIDRYKFDRGIWQSLRGWGRLSPTNACYPEPKGPNLKGAA